MEYIEHKFKNKAKAIKKQDQIDKKYGYASLFVMRNGKRDDYCVLEPMRC